MGLPHLFANGAALGVLVLTVVIIAAVIVIAVALVSRASRRRNPQKR